jgi:uncharacterized protein YggT (Ycf19 family)
LALKLVTLLRLVSFMVLIYLFLGWLVERYSRAPESKLKAFFRLVCSPVVRPVQRFLSPGASYGRALAVGAAAVGAVWVVSIVLSEVLRPG